MQNVVYEMADNVQEDAGKHFEEVLNDLITDGAKILQFQVVPPPTNNGHYWRMFVLVEE